MSQSLRIAFGRFDLAPIWWPMPLWTAVDLIPLLRGRALSFRQRKKPPELGEHSRGSYGRHGCNLLQVPSQVGGGDSLAANKPRPTRLGTRPGEERACAGYGLVWATFEGSGPAIEIHTSVIRSPSAN